MITLEFQPNIDAYEPSLAAARDAVAKFAGACCQPLPENKPTRDPFAAALASVSNPPPQTWLTLAGVNGCGKTMLAAQAFQFVSRNYPFAGSVWISGDRGRLTSRRPKCVWIDEVSFSKRCKEGEYDLPEYLGEDWLVVLDDLGASRDKSGFTGEMLFRLCNARVGKFTMFTTNLDLTGITTQIDPRIASRLIRDGNQFKAISAGDYSIRKLKSA